MEKKTAALYGAGNSSLKAESILRTHMPDVNVRYLVENKAFAKLGDKVNRIGRQSEPLEVISIGALKEKYAQNECHSVIIPGTYSVFDFREIDAVCKRIGINSSNIQVVAFNRMVAPVETTDESMPILTPLSELAQIYHLDIHVVDHCNLRCSACGHFSCLVDKEVVYSAETIYKSLAHLSKLVPNIQIIQIVGGEPLLHPNLDTVIESVRKFYPYAVVNIITNGLLLKNISASLCSCIRSNRVNMTVSLYPPQHDQVDNLVGWLRSKMLSFFFIKVETFERRFLPVPLFDNWRMFAKCGHNMGMRGSQVGYCVNALFADYYNKRFGDGLLPEDKGVDVFEHSNSKSFLKALHQPLELCRQCVACDAGKQFFRDWELAGDSPRAEDWLIDFPFEVLTEDRRINDT